MRNNRFSSFAAFCLGIGAILLLIQAGGAFRGNRIGYGYLVVVPFALCAHEGAVELLVKVRNGHVEAEDLFGGAIVIGDSVRRRLDKRGAVLLCVLGGA